MKLNLVDVSTRPGVAVEILPMGPLPDDPVVWARRDLAHSPPAQVELVDETEIFLAGWPALVLSARTVATVESGQPVRKLVVMLLILEYCAVVRLRCAEGDFEDEKRELLRVLDLAVIDWEGQPLTLAAIWEGIS